MAHILRGMFVWATHGDNNCDGINRGEASMERIDLMTCGMNLGEHLKSKTYCLPPIIRLSFFKNYVSSGFVRL